MRQLIGPILFMASSGILFNEEMRRNRTVVGFTGAVAVLATIFTADEAVKRISAFLDGTQDSAIGLTRAALIVGASIFSIVIGAVLSRLIETRHSRERRKPDPISRSDSRGTWGNWIAATLRDINSVATVASVEYEDRDVGLFVISFAILLSLVFSALVFEINIVLSFFGALVGLYLGFVLGVVIATIGVAIARRIVPLVFMGVFIVVLVGSGVLLHTVWTAFN